MLLFSTSRTAGTIPAPVPAVLPFTLSWIHSSPDKCMAAIVIQVKSPFASQPLRLTLRPSRLLSVQQSAAATAEDHCCCLPPPSAQVATQMLQPTSNPAAPSVKKWVCVSQLELG